MIVVILRRFYSNCPNCTLSYFTPRRFFVQESPSSPGKRRGVIIPGWPGSDVQSATQGAPKATAGGRPQTHHRDKIFRMSTQALWTFYLHAAMRSSLFNCQHEPLTLSRTSWSLSNTPDISWGSLLDAPTEIVSGNVITLSDNKQVRALIFCGGPTKPVFNNTTSLSFYHLDSFGS